MLIKYPNTWKATYFESPLDQSGNITTIAAEWVLQLTGLSNMEIKQGIDNLANRDNKAFPPNAMEFKDLCVGSEYESALNAIICRLQIGQVYEWTDKTAFNIWMVNSSSFLNSNITRVPNLVKTGLMALDKENLNPLPVYQVKQITEEENYISYSEWLKTKTKSNK
jgi:hypothetical protein